MSIFDSLVGSPKIQNGSRNGRMNPMQLLGKLKSDPQNFVRESGFNVPKDCTDAREMVKYLLDTNQVDNGQIQMIRNVVSSRRR